MLSSSSQNNLNNLATPMREASDSAPNFHFDSSHKLNVTSVKSQNQKYQDNCDYSLQYRLLKLSQVKISGVKAKNPTSPRTYTSHVTVGFLVSDILERLGNPIELQKE